MRRQLLFLLLVMGLSLSIFSFLPVKKDVAIVQRPWLDSVLSTQHDTTYLINFWATWCVPCVAELPDFEKIHNKYRDQKVKVILISLDYVKKKDDVLIPFLAKKAIDATVVLLNEPDANSWIDRVDQQWSGALPGTLLLNKSKRLHIFFEKELNFEQLDSLIQQTIQ